MTEAHKLKSWVERKLSDGDVSGAVRVLCSDNTVAPFDNEALEALCNRHPPSPTDLCMPSPPDMSIEPLQVTTATIEKCIRSFKPGSAAGPDKLSPHI